MERALSDRLRSLPVEPGIYLMRDREGTVVYVGKAKNLRARVQSYFRKNGDQRAFVAMLDGLLGDVETIVVDSEEEALLLENECIKKYQPRFNVRLRDDKNYISLRLDVREKFPRLEIVRQVKDDGARYFGPYPSAHAIRETLKLINRFFRLRTCSDHVLANRKRPCLLYQIGRCPAPCVFEVPPDEYGEAVSEVALFLGGRAPELLDSLAARMRKASDELRYEDAARFRDQLEAIRRSLERQRVWVGKPIDQDAFGLYREGDRLALYVLYVRGGRMTGGRGYYFSGQEFPDVDLLGSFVNLYYDKEGALPDEVLLPLASEENLGLGLWLTGRKGSRVFVRVPKRGDRRKLVEMSVKNARQTFLERTRTEGERLGVLERLQVRLGLPTLPRRIECFDVSHHQGSAIVASQVTAMDGEPDASRYRRFRIKTLRSQNDFASVYEVVFRRVHRGKATGDLPDLLVIDGGRGQLGSARAALRDLGLENVGVVALAKGRPSEGDGQGRKSRSQERVFLAGVKNPVVLPPNSPELLVLTRLRDEAHRFAITYHQKLMRRRSLASVLDGIPGVGPRRRRNLLRTFGSLARVREASAGELEAAGGLGAVVAKKVFDFLHSADAPVPAETLNGDTVWESSLEDAASSDN